MKKGIIVVLIGVLLIGASIILFSKESSSSDSGISFKYFLDNSIKLYKADDSFSYLYVEEYASSYYLTVRTRKYMTKDDFPTAVDSSFKEQVLIDDHTLTGENGVKATFKDSSIILESTGDYSFFNGTYKYEPKAGEFSIMKESSDISGYYSSPFSEDLNATETYHFVIMKRSDNVYTIKGVITKPDEYYIFIGDDFDDKIDNGKGTFRDIEYLFTIKDNKLSIESENGFMNGQYNKITKLGYDELVKEMEAMVQYGEGVTGINVN